MIPNILFSKSDDKESLFSKCNDYKLLAVMNYLHINTNRLGETLFTLKDMIFKSGVKFNAGKGKSNDQFKKLLLLLQEEGILSNNFNVNEIKPNDLIRCTYDAFEKDKEGNNIRFAMIECDIIEKIRSYCDEKIDNNRLLYYYGYLAHRMYKRSHAQETGGKAEVCYPSYKLITEETGIVDATIKLYNDILIKMDLLRVANPGMHKFTSNNKLMVKESPNFYAFVRKEDIGVDDKNTTWYKNLKQAVDLYKRNAKENYQDSKFITVKSEDKLNKRKINGYKGSLIKKYKNGTITEEEEIKLNIITGRVATSQYRDEYEEENIV